MDNDVKKEVLFAIPLYSKILPKYYENRKQILERIQTLVREELEENSKNNYRCCEQLHLDDSKYTRWLMQRLANIAAGCIKEHNADLMLNHEVHLLSSWVNIHPQGVWTKPRTHSQFDWSGVFYAQVSEDLNKETGLIFLNPFPHKQKWASKTKISIDAVDGLMVLFPSHITHIVPPHKDTINRISISFNLRLLPCSPIPSLIGDAESV